jgi:DNA polymerase V
MSTKTTGFASPAQGYEEQNIDLNRLLIRNPPATFFMRLDTSDMASLGLPRGSLLIVDRSQTPAANQYVLLRHDGQFLCRLLLVKNGKALFTDGSTEFPPAPDETEIIGVVTASIKEYTNGDAR